jgi:hypothetical protein
MQGAAGAARRRAACLSVVLTVPASSALAGIEQNTEDRVDDARAQPAAMTAMATKGNWVIVPIPVANPTVGNGLQVAVLYLHPKSTTDDQSPSATTGAVTMATNGGARMNGVFHDGSFDNDRFRVSAYAGTGKFDLKFYGIGDGNATGGRALPYEMSGTVVQMRGGMRLPGTADWFAGLTVLYLDSTLTFQTSQLSPGLPDVPIQFRNVGLGPYLQYDSRDSNYYPMNGQYLRAGWMNFSSRWGSDVEFDKGDAFYNAYVPLSSASVMGLRARLQTASDSTPFYELPTLDMRGFSRDRYRDKVTLSLASEWRHKFSPRWGMAAYVEAGRVAPAVAKLHSARTITTCGGGVRWQVSADRDLNVGLDYAVSSDDKAVFLQIGERF